MARNPWFPLRASEVQTALGVFGFFATALAFAGVHPPTLAVAAIVYLVAVYFVGLLVQAARASARYAFIEDGGLAGRGHLARFRKAQRSLLLMHVDDDVPSEELRALYASLLDGGVQIRRIVFLRQEESPPWITESAHPNLVQRVVGPDEARFVLNSFAIVDDAELLLSVPGYATVDDDAYTAKLFLRHLMCITDATAVAVFARTHEMLWKRAHAVSR